MNINIELSEEYVSKLLRIFDYVTEEVLVWYNKFDEDWCPEDLGCYHKTVAYPRDERPEILKKEKIMFDDVKGMGVNDVVNVLFNELLTAKLFG